ncbi:MAG: translocation/assembly module TamB domain-containing protein [Candidatus Fervidibacter sp.]|uniref:translocation/assembly module TamB domain-containing protein n=1 Tax=Candidatus Fervidibacter sp. TaxID=3100871 RepID=UPI00404A87B0
MARFTAPLFMAFTFTVLIAIGLWQVKRHLPSPSEWAKLLEVELTKTLSTTVKVEGTKVSLTGATLKNLRIQPDARSPTGYILTVPELKLRWSLWNIVRPSRWKKVAQAQVEQAIHQIIVANATLFLWRDQAGRWNFQPFLAQKPTRKPVKVPPMQIRDSTLVLGDETLPLSDRLPFRLKLVNVQATVQPIELGTRVEAQGQLPPPLGTPDSQALLTIVQTSNEAVQETHGRLVVTNIKVASLPDRLLSLGDGRVKVIDGTISQLVLNWQQTGSRGQLGGTARLEDAVAVLQGKEIVKPSLLDSEVAFNFHSVGQRVLSWQFTVRTLRTHPQFGDGVIAAEGFRDSMRVRWRGKGLPVNTIHLLAPYPLLIRGGEIDGEVTVEAQRKRLKVIADLSVRQTTLYPTEELKKFQATTVAISSASVEARVEHWNSRLIGSLDISAKSAVGEAGAKIWLDGNKGRAKVKIVSLRLAPLRHTILSLLPNQIRSLIELRDGKVSGTFALSWAGKNFRLKELNGQVHQLTFSGDGFPPTCINASVFSDGKTLRVTQIKAQLDSNELMLLSGQTTISQTPIWQVQGQLSPSAVKRMAAWAIAKWNLPLHLLFSGKSQINAGGAGTQWQAQLAWDEPSFVAKFQDLKWQAGLGRLTVFAAPQGAMALVNKASARPSQVYMAIGDAVLQLPEGLKFSELRLVWDERQKLAIAYGSVNIPRFELDGLSLGDGVADLELAFSLSDKPFAELRATNINAKFLNGALKDGKAILLGNERSETVINASVQFQDCELDELVRWLRRGNANAPTAEGKFTGKLVISAKIPSSLRLSLDGKATDFKASGSDWKTNARDLRLTNLVLLSTVNNEDWVLRQISADGFGLNIWISKGKRKAQIERVQFQTAAKRTGEGWLWDIRLPNAKAFGGTISGQARGTPEHVNGHLGFSGLNIAQLLKFADLGSKEKPPEGQGSGWLKFTAEKKNSQWKGNWESASLGTDVNWNDLTVKVAGARAYGNLIADEKFNLQQANGKVEGIHLLSDDGQAVLDGTVSFKRGVPALLLKGRWTGVSLRRLSQKFDLPVELKGLAEGTLQITWDGEWRLSGTVKSQAVALGESTVWNDIFGKWVWSENALRVEQVQAKWNGGSLTAEGYIGTTAGAPSHLSIQAEKIALLDLSRLVQEWELTVGDFYFYGQAEGKVWVSRVKDQTNATVSLKSDQVRLGLTPLGKARLDLTVTHKRQKGEPLVSANGIFNLQHNGMVVTAELERKQQRWQIQWRGGDVPISTLRQMASEWSQRLGGEAKETLEQWLNLPLTGTIWTEGSVVVNDGQIAEANAKVTAPSLLGISELPSRAVVIVSRRGKLWSVDLTELKQGAANAFGSITLTDDGVLTGNFELNQVPSKLAVNLLRLFGTKIEFEQVPDGSLSAQLKIAGTKERPVVEGALKADEVYWKGWMVRQILVRHFEFRDGTIKVDKGDGIVKWKADASLSSFWGWVNLNGKRRLFWQIDLPPTTLDAFLLPGLMLQIENGWLSGSISFQGSLEEPKVKGLVEARAEKIYLTEPKSVPKPLANLTTFHDVHCQIEADERTVKLTQFAAKLNSGTVVGSGWMELREGGLENLFANKGKLTFAARNLRTNWGDTVLNLQSVALKGELSENGFGLLVEELQGDGLSMQGNVTWGEIPKDKWMWLSDGKWNLTLKFNEFRWKVNQAKGELSGLLALRSQKEGAPPTLLGNLTIHDGDILRLPVVGPAKSGEWKLPPALQFAVRLEIGDKFFLRNPQASLVLGGELSLSGDLSRPSVEGELRSRKGTLRMPATVLTIADLSVRAVYAIDPLTRQWVGTARLRVEGETLLDIHRILFTVSGPVDAQSQRLGILPSVTMLAIPPLPEQTALERMFGPGLTQLGNALTDWRLLFSGALVQSFMGDLLAPVTEPIAQALRWTELSVVREQKTGRQWLRLGIPLAPRLHVLWRKGLSPADPSAVEVQYYLGKRTSVTVIKRERERAEVRVQTSVRF